MRPPLADQRAFRFASASSTRLSSGEATEFPVVGADKRESGFAGITSRDSSIANLGGIIEPPDQGLATNGSQVFEAVNLAFRIFTSGGKPLSDPIDLASFFGSVTGNLTDPRVFFDPQSKHFFFTVLQYETDATTGAILGSQDLIAVSQTSDATGNYNIYSVDISIPEVPNCVPGCSGDQPLIGINEDGLFISNNEFSNSLVTPFVGVLIVALDKDALINNTPLHGAELLLPNDFSVQPSLPAPGAVTTQHNGTEYFMESLDFGPPTNGNSLRIFSLTNTESLKSVSPAAVLSANDFPTETYSFPSPANQKAGSFPLGSGLLFPEEFLNSDDDRLQQLYFANNKLYTALETALPDADESVVRSGAAWFVVDPEGSGNTVSGSILAQGYIGIKNGSVLYPAFAVNNSGDGIIGFSFSGTDFFPSAGYVKFEDGAVEQKVHVAGAGQAPEDGFTGYPPFGIGVARWGDYSAAVVSPAGHLWFGAEYIPNDILHPRTPVTNWGTFISRVE